MATKKTPNPVAAAADSLASKVESLKHIADSGRSTQETHRKSIDAETTSLSKYLDMLNEQSKRAATAEERADIRKEAREERKIFSEKIDSHKEDSNSVFLTVLKYGFLAVGLAVGTTVAVAKLKDK